ncbi:MAG: M28 family peptidase, partial [Gemmatimonadota bacterium]|nr:M28 family peptidase [Gemmatimonadota bacterium]
MTDLSFDTVMLSHTFRSLRAIHSLRVLLIPPVLAACHTAAVSPSRQAPDTAAIRQDIVYLASDALEGRATGTAGNDSAAAYISRRLEQLGLRPELQRFTARSVAAAHAGLAAELPTQNVVAILRGSDAALRDEYIVIGAHHDHLGRTAFGALDPNASDAIRNGADDNASGTAAVIELARILSRSPPKRSIIFATFSAEELGLLGSQHLVDNFPVPLSRVVAMLNFDMVGRLRDEKLIVYGTGTATELPAILDSVNSAHSTAGAPAPLDVRGMSDGFGPSDHSSFYAKDIPVLHFFTDIHEDYHRATDDSEKVNIAGTARVIAYAERIVRRIADGPERLTFTRTVAPRAAASSRQ